jgi:hypothetical protein
MGFGLTIGCTEQLQNVTINNYDSLTEIYTPKGHRNYSTHQVFSVFTSRCLVAASNGGRSRFSGFPNCSPPTTHFPQLELSTDSTTGLLVISILRRHGPQRKSLFHYCVFSRCRGNNLLTELLPNNGCCTVAYLHRCFLAMGLHVTIC